MPAYAVVEKKKGSTFEECGTLLEVTSGFEPLCPVLQTGD